VRNLHDDGKLGARWVNSLEGCLHSRAEKVARERLRARMGSSMDATKLVYCDTSVDLGGSEVSVPKHRLDGA
jgi:hypothetical protein